MTFNTVTSRKLVRILWPLGSLPTWRELHLGPGTMKSFVSGQLEAIGKPFKRWNSTTDPGGLPVSQTQVPWRVERWCFRFRTPDVLSLLSEGFCCEISTRALAIARPDCPGGGAPEDPRGRQRNTVRTAALFPAHGSMAMGLGGPSNGPRRKSARSAPTSSATSTEAKGRLAICCRSRSSCSLRREAQHVCLIFQTTAATNSKDKKQLKKVTKNCTRSMIVLCCENAICILIGQEKLLTYT